MLKIYGRSNSSNVQKVLWACEELRVPFTREDVGGAFGKNREPAYLALNPNGLVPTIDDDGFILWESNAIVRYLAAKHGQGGLWPADPRQRAAADRWMDWQASTVSPAIFPLFYQLVRTPADRRDQAAIEAGREKTIAALTILDAQLANTEYVAGGALTMGDIALGIAAHRWFAFPIERPELPHLAAWYKRLAERPAYRKHVMQPLT
ncbi:MAG: glutathione S-transferase family protein [Pseudomonadota bacterium]